jgi:peroxiredoxin
MIRAALLLSASALLGLGGCEKAKSGPAPAAAAPPGPAAVTSAALGQSAPDFTLKDEQGKEHRLSSYKGKVVVLEWTSPKCPFVRRHYDSGAMPKLAASLDKAKVVWLAIDSNHFNTAQDSATWKKEKGFEYPVLQDPDGKVGHAYGARTTPHMFVIDAAGVLRYAGAIDNDPRGNAAERTNYVQTTVRDVLEGRTPSPAQTKPYGCTVKYQS